MRRAVLLTLLILLAGCQGFAGDTETPSETRTAPSAETTEMASSIADPASDRLGWENGRWYNETIAVTADDGLNDSEREAVVARAMARVERVRQLEFEETVPVRVINRSEYAENRSGQEYSAALERFDNEKFESLFLVGEDEGSIDEQNSNRNATVLGYYSPGRDAIVLVSNEERPTISGEETLAHELVHALQDQHFDVLGADASTRDALQGRNGLIEGDASYTENRYTSRCGAAWSCVAGPESAGGGGGGDVHAGINFFFYFPYSSGFGFVEELYQRGGWDAVDDAYDDVPDGAAEVVRAAEYPGWTPAEVRIEDRSGEAWSRISPPDRPDYGVVGQSGIVAGLAYTLLDDYNETSVVGPAALLNADPGGEINRTQPYRYTADPAAGWEGGRFYAYENGDRSGYVWRTEWTDADEAREFAEGWGAVIRHWGGERTGPEAWRIDEGPFADAFEIRVDGSTVTVVNGPDAAAVDAIHARP